MEESIEVIKLKAKAYNLLANIESLQRELQATNQQIAEEMKKLPTNTEHSGK